MRRYPGGLAPFRHPLGPPLRRVASRVAFPGSAGGAWWSCRQEHRPRQRDRDGHRRQAARQGEGS